MTQQETAEFVNELRATFREVELLAMPTVAVVDGALRLPCAALPAAIYLSPSFCEDSVWVASLVASMRTVDDLLLLDNVGCAGFAIGGGAELALACDLRVAGASLPPSLASNHQ